MKIGFLKMPISCPKEAVLHLFRGIFYALAPNHFYFLVNFLLYYDDHGIYTACSCRFSGNLERKEEPCISSNQIFFGV